MYFEGCFRRIGQVDPDPLIEIIQSFGEGAWDEYDVRQRLFQPHRKTQTIPLLFDLDGRHANPTQWPRLKTVGQALMPALHQIADAHREPGEISPRKGYFIRIILTRMAPDTEITPHRDGGDSLLKSHRYHLALTTNDRVEFTVGDETRHFASGEIWEINNRLEHSVRNLGDSPRVHAVIDYVVPGELVMDPDGQVVA